MANSSTDPNTGAAALAEQVMLASLEAAADGIVIDAKPAGKWKTALQMIAIPAVMIEDILWGIPFGKIGYVTLWVSVVLSVTSGWEYYRGYVQSKKKVVSSF